MTQNRVGVMNNRNANDGPAPNRQSAFADDYDCLTRNRGSGNGVIGLPLNPLARSLGASSAAMGQEKMIAQSG